MLSMLLAALLAAAPTPTHLHVYDIKPPTEQSLVDRAKICLEFEAGDKTPQKIVDELHLHTRAQQQEFVNDCGLFIEGVSAGVRATIQKEQQDGPQGSNPTAARISND